MIDQHFPYIFSTFLVTLLLVQMLRKAAPQIGLVDKPGGRKHHKQAIPVVGGLAMFIGFTLAIWALGQPLQDHYGLLAGMALLVVVGMLDDRYDVSARSRLLVQIAAVVLMISHGDVALYQLGNLLGHGDIQLHRWTVPFTIFVVVGIINAFNMADGTDGLAGGLSLISAVWLIIVALLSGAYPETVMLLLVLVAAIMGFLHFNLRHPWRKRAVVFMGDAGSMMLGFVLAWFAIELCQGERPAMSPITAAWILGLPMLDTVCIMLRRILKGRSPFAADREHLHHILLLAGYSDAKTVAILLRASAGLGAVGVAGLLLGVPDVVMFYAFVGLFGLYCFAMSHAWNLMKAIKHPHIAPVQQASTEMEPV